MLKDTLFSKKQLINLRGAIVPIAQPLVMGIVNLTPDSFYDGGRYTQPELMLRKVSQLLAEGADIIDLGGYSSRPGAVHITPEEEFQRLASGLQLIRRDFPDAILSVDTFRADIARRVVQEFQVDIINDISGGTLDYSMAETIASLQVPYIAMHMPGSPQTMQYQTGYKQLVPDIIHYLSGRINQLKSLGINDIIIDPGFGFGKTREQNFELLQQLEAFRILDFPLLVGISRKSMIYSTLNITPDEALNGTTALHMAALERGANILRVHDVKEAIQTVKLFTLLRDSVQNA